MELFRSFIHGQFVDPQQACLHDVYNPALGQVVGHVAFADSDLVAQAIDSAYQSYLQWSQVTPLRRARVIFNFKQLLERDADKIAQAITEQHGKIFTDAKGEVLRAIELVEFFCGIPNLLKGSYSQNVGTGIDCYTFRQPLGICVGVAPFNFPVMVSTWMLIPAIACGNSFILKPSEKDPSAALMLVELMKEAGLPDGVLNLLQGDREVVSALITHKKVAAVSCVGSTPVAESIYKTAIEHGKRAHTFGGAKNHCVIMPDANIDIVNDALVASAYGAAGERCMAVSVAIAVTEHVADSLVKKLKEKINTIVVGAGIEPNTEMGPLINQAHWQRVNSYIEQGVAEGADLVVDGRAVCVKGFEKGFFMGACLFDHVTKEMSIYQEEIFGPVLVIVRVKNLEEAIELINDHPYGNGTAIFTNDGGLARNFADRIQVGMVGINVPIPVPVAYHSFGGWKRSIFGDIHMHGSEGVLFYTKPKTVTQRWPDTTTTLSSFNIPTQ